MVGETVSTIAATSTTTTPGNSSAVLSSTTSTMERLELLSSTAVLKQGIEGNRRNEKGPIGFSSGVVMMGSTPFKILHTPHHEQHSPSSVSTTISQHHIFSVAAATAIPALMADSSPFRSAMNSATTVATTPNPGASKTTSNIASPVSSDGDDNDAEDDHEDKDGHEASQANSSHRRNNGREERHTQGRPTQLDEARSPVATVDYTRGRDAPRSSFGLGLPLIPARFEPFHRTCGHPETSFINVAHNSPTTPSGSPYHHQVRDGTVYRQPHHHQVRDQRPHNPEGSFLLPVNNHGGSLYHLHELHHSVTRSSTPTSSASMTDEHTPHHHAPLISHLSSRRFEDGPQPRQLQQQQQPSYEALTQEVNHMREQLKEKDIVVSSLQHRVNYLENQINELRQLPTGKISHIPVDDMIRIMQEYGSEVSNQTLPQRKQAIKKASIVRQFRRWNPEFFRFFIHVNGEWVPKLGRDGELRRRAEKRRLMKQRNGANDEMAD